jgi:asparagine synthase (glutamine-hydrolysing)
MCGIAGYCGPSQRFSNDRLLRMLRAIEHRGPDDEGTFCAAGRNGNGVWLGSRRLAIQDLSLAGHQPMAEPAGRHVVAFNGEIYNFLDLRAELERAGQQFASRCDTEVALHLWAREGPAAVQRWRGMFGAAVWDAERQELWLMRDPWGIKPLYYHWDGEGVAFCSEVRGLLAAEVAPRRLSRRGVQDYLRYGAVQDPVTMIDGVYALLPGHVLRWSEGKIETRRYPAAEASPGMVAGYVEPMLREIVRQQLISDVPVVVFLSGGVDSSVLSLVARQEAGAGVHTMAVVFEEGKYSEQPFARRVARHIGTEHHEVLLRGAEAREKAVEAISRMDQPTVDGVNTYVVSAAARRAGFTVALSGLGGDEFFGGYPSFRRAARLEQIRQWAQRAPGLAGVAGRVLDRHGREATRKLGQYLDHGDYFEHPYFLQRTLFFPKQAEALSDAGEVSPEAERVAEARRQWLVEQAAPLDLWNQISLLEARTYMTNMLLRDSDQMSMACSLELRVPLVDHVLAGRLLATPGPEKGFDRTPKLWLKEVFGPQLPAEVFGRKKMGFTLPLAVWMKGPLRAEIEGTLRRNPGGVWNAAGVAGVWDDFWEGRVSWSRPWALYVLSRWVEQNLGAASA